MKAKVDYFYELFDQAALLHYEKLGLDYYQAFLKVARGINSGQIDARFNDEEVNSLEEIYQKFSETEFYNEEVRLACELLIIKAFKHIKMPLDLMTPDTVNYLIIEIVNGLFKADKIRILDTALGTGNLLFAIHHHYKEALLVGLEKEVKLIELAQACSQLQGCELTIYLQDALENFYGVFDLVIGDLDAYYLKANLGLDDELYQSGISYFPYLVMAKRISNLKAGGYFIYVINNDFFSQEKSEVFRDYLQKESQLLGLIVLPKTMVQKGHPGKSILIGQKQAGQSKEIALIEIASFEKESLKKSIDKLQIMIERIAEE